jgi:hypothetical protein
MNEEAVPDHELPDELPEKFTGKKVMLMHLNYGNGGGGLYRWHGADGRAWPIQEQYDTRRPKPATKKKPAFEPNKTGVVIIDHTQPGGFYGEVVNNYRELREIWKEWRASKKPPADRPAQPLQEWPFPKDAR